MIPSFRIGQGYDVHVLVEERPLILGGVPIPFPLGLAGHSDADVLSHALGDALLGASGLGDLGHHFPDTDPRFKGISSLHLLEQIMMMVREQGYEIENADILVVAQEPKISIYKEKIKGLLAETLNCAFERINIKATTTEGLGFTGRKEGIAAYAVVLLMRMK
jgi:2-C-methyl-D-erythritol 2,4-cyclodiphosphate synthase